MHIGMGVTPSFCVSDCHIQTIPPGLSHLVMPPEHAHILSYLFLYLTQVKGMWPAIYWENIMGFNSYDGNWLPGLAKTMSFAERNP